MTVQNDCERNEDVHLATISKLKRKIENLQVENNDLKKKCSKLEDQNEKIIAVNMKYQSKILVGSRNNFGKRPIVPYLFTIYIRICIIHLYEL